MTAPTATTIARNAAIRFRAISESSDWLRSHLWAMEDAAVNELGQLYLNYYRELVNELMIAVERYGGTWSASDAAFRARTEYLLSQIRDDVGRLTDETTARTFEAMVRGYGGGYYGTAWIVDNGLRTGAYANIPLLPVEAIRAAMLQPYLGSTFLDRFADARDEFVRRIRRSIVESQIRGESITQATVRLRNALGITGDAKGLWARAEMIARTEILRASNEGALLIYEANQDVLKGFQWRATLDERVCPICGQLDGEQWTFKDEYPVPPSHARCRCAILPVLLDSELEAAIVGPYKGYREWAAERGISVVNDGGILRFRGARPPKSQTDAAKAAAPHLYTQ